MLLPIMVGLLGLPRSSAANWSPTSDEALQVELQRLQEVRDRLDQQRAAQRTLRAEAGVLAEAIDALRVRFAKLSAELQSRRQQALVLEQQLDRLVPRLLARAAEVRERQVRTALAIADLASKARRVRVDSTVRARMLAISPLMLDRLRKVESGLGSLSARPERTIQRHAQVTHRLSELTTAQQRLSSRLERKQRLRQVAVARLRGLDAEVQLLGDEETRLASRLLHAEAAIAARAEPQAHQHALSDPIGQQQGLRGREASVEKSLLGRGARLARAAQAEYRSALGLLAVAPMADEVVDLAEEPRGPTLASRAEPLAAVPAGKIAEGWPGAPQDVVGRTARLDVVFTPDRDRSDVGLAAKRGNRATPPLLPVPEELQKRMALRDRPEMTVAAAPGQMIAAPVDGRVVFAERFKSYGLLLIIEHEREYHTLLWGFARLDVSLGERVRVGQIVGIMDAMGEGPPVLHVERRRNGRPINLAASSSGIQG